MEEHSGQVFHAGDEDPEGVAVLSDGEDQEGGGGDGGDKMVELSSDSEGEDGPQRKAPRLDNGSGGGGPSGVEGLETQVIPSTNGNTNGDANGGGEDTEMTEAGPPVFDEKWRDSRLSTTEKMAFALDNKRLFHDVTFLVGEDKEEISAHRTILAICSGVFETMFFGPDLEFPPESISLTEHEPSAFRALLKYLYTGGYDVNLDNAIGIMRAAKAFDLRELLAMTGDFLKKNLSEKNAITFYQAAELFEEKGLEESSYEFLLNNFWAVAKSDDFLNITYANLCKFLDEDEINISELDFFNAVLRWASEECQRQDMKDTSENMRTVLQDALTLIRFPLMSSKEFALQVVPKFILGPMEVITIFQHLSVDLEEREGLPQVFCKSESRKKRKVANPALLVQNLKSTRLRVRVRPCDRFVKNEPSPVSNPMAAPRKRTSINSSY